MVAALGKEDMGFVGEWFCFFTSLSGMSNLLM